MEPQPINLIASEIDNTTGKTCLDYFDDQNLQFATGNNIKDYAAIAENFRNADASIKVGAHFFTNGYILPCKDIKKLLNPEDKTVITGIKIYHCIDLDKEGKPIVRLLAVGTYKEDDKHIFSDYGIPKNKELLNPIMILAEPRPCPKQCGTANVLNPTPEE